MPYSEDCNDELETVFRIEKPNQFAQHISIAASLKVLSEYPRTKEIARYLFEDLQEMYLSVIEYGILQEVSFIENEVHTMNWDPTSVAGHSLYIDSIIKRMEVFCETEQEIFCHVDFTQFSIDVLIRTLLTVYLKIENFGLNGRAQLLIDVKVLQEEMERIAGFGLESMFESLNTFCKKILLK